MATHASALKAHRQTINRQLHNRQLRTRLRSTLKSVRAAIDAGDPARAKDALREAFSIIDRTASKGIIHDNTAARHKSRLVKRWASKTSATA